MIYKNYFINSMDDLFCAIKQHEKELTVKDVISLIEDFNSFVRIPKNEKLFLETKIDELNKEIEILEDEFTDYKAVSPICSNLSCEIRA